MEKDKTSKLSEKVMDETMIRFKKVLENLSKRNSNGKERSL